MEKAWNELLEKKNIRENLSRMRQLIKDDLNREHLEGLLIESPETLFSLLKDEDAKSRKNAALLLGDLEWEDAVDALWEAYCNESTLFVKSAYLAALSQFDMEEHLGFIKERLEQLQKEPADPENQKHIGEEIRVLRRMIVSCEGITHHTFSAEGKNCEVLLITNREQKEAVCGSISCGRARIHPLGVLVETDRLDELRKVRTYRELLFPIHTQGLLSADPRESAQKLWKSDLWELLCGLHKENSPFYFRIECQSEMTLEERSIFTRKLSAGLEKLSESRLCNSTSDYEVEIRLTADKNKRFFPCLRLYTIKDRRFFYRKNCISASIHPSTAALLMELSEPYLKKNAQIMDPFCGVGTMLIERNIRVPAKEKYATDIFGDAIGYARENAALAKEDIHFIHRDFFDFRHAYLFDEIVTNMPFRGKRTKEEMDIFYGRFFQKALEILAKEAVIIMYTNELGFVRKQIRIRKEFHLLQEYCIQKKTDFYLLIIQVKR